jgi:hypothetical protein
MMKAKSLLETVIIAIGLFVPAHSVTTHYERPAFPLSNSPFQPVLSARRKAAQKFLKILTAVSP